MTTPSLNPPAPSPADLLVGRADLLRQIAQYIAFHDLDLTTLELSSTGVQYLTRDRNAAVCVAEAFGAVPQDDYREVVTDGRLNVHEHWASDVLRVSWCKRLETAA